MKRDGVANPAVDAGTPVDIDRAVVEHRERRTCLQQFPKRGSRFARINEEPFSRLHVRHAHKQASPRCQYLSHVERFLVYHYVVEEEVDVDDSTEAELVDEVRVVDVL